MIFISIIYVKSSIGPSSAPYALCMAFILQLMESNMASGDMGNEKLRWILWSGWHGKCPECGKGYKSARG